MRRLSATFEEMEKARQEEAQGHRRNSSSSSSLVSEVSQDDLLANTIYIAGKNEETNDRDRKDSLSQTDDQLELGAEGKYNCF